MSLELLREIFALRRKSFMLLALLLAADLSLYLYHTWSQQPELERVQKEWFAKREAVARGAVRPLQQRYQQAEQELAKFQQRVIAKHDFAAFLSDLFALAKTSSLSLKGVSYTPTQVKEEQDLVSYGISFNVSGKYAGVKRFIADVVRLPQLVTLDSINLTNTSQTEESVSMGVKLTVYLKKEGA
jgi:type IV pilus assembly protein PilO